MNVELVLKYVALVLVIVGALNWGLVGAFHFNFVTAVFLESVVTQVIYIAIGLAGLYVAYLVVAKKI